MSRPTSAKFQELLDASFAVGTLTTIATGGALLGLGLRDGEAGRAFRLAGRGLLETIGVPSQTAPLTSVALGYLHHLIIATGWGVLLALIVLPQRGVWRVAGAIIAAAAYFAVSLTVLPALLRVGYGVTGTLAGAVPVGVAVALSLCGGAWVSAEAESGDD